MIITVIFYIFVACTVLQLLYYLFFSIFLFSTKKKFYKTIPQLPVSVIICAKNEAENIKKFLPSIINQNYPNFEIVLINDGSTDKTLEIMEFFEKKNNNIKIVNVEPVESFWGNKKYALTLGIKAAKNDYLLFTDADCKPISKKWITEMTKQFTNKKQIILGYGKYMKENKLVNLLVRYETLLTAMQYFSYEKAKIPYMGVGRNLAYHKDEFYKVKGFINHIHIKSGDDDLFIRDASTKENTTICVNPNSFTLSKAPESFKQWFRQKRRHISTANNYKLKHQILLGLFFLTKVLFLIFSILFLLIHPWQTILPLISSYYLIIFIVIGLSAKKLQEKKIIYFIPFLDIGLVLFQFSIFITNMFIKPKHWR